MRSKRHITKRAQQFAGRAEQTIRSVAKPLAKYGFPWRAPTVPRGVEVPESLTLLAVTSKPIGHAALSHRSLDQRLSLAH